MFYIYALPTTLRVLADIRLSSSLLNRQSVMRSTVNYISNGHRSSFQFTRFATLRLQYNRTSASIQSRETITSFEDDGRSGEKVNETHHSRNGNRFNSSMTPVVLTFPLLLSPPPSSSSPSSSSPCHNSQLVS